MATAAVTNTFVAGTAAEAAEVNTNFTNLVTFLNNSVVHRDGTKAMTAAFDGGGFKLTNVAAAAATSDAPRFDQTGIAECETTSGAVTLPDATLTTVDTATVTVPAAGVGLLVTHLQLNATGVTFGGGDISVNFSVSSTAGTGGPIGGSTSSSLTTNGTTNALVTLWVFPLSSGANTVTLSITSTRMFGATGGTVTVVSGARSAVLGAF